MEVTDIINSKTLEAFELFAKSVDIANSKTLNIAIKKISKEINETYFYLESKERKERFNYELFKARDKINKECKIIITEWFEEFVV